MAATASAAWQQFASAFDFDPLRYTETASVGLLATAAGRAGFLTLAEYVADKRAPGRGRPIEEFAAVAFSGRSAELKGLYRYPFQKLTPLVAVQNDYFAEPDHLTPIE